MMGGKKIKKWEKSVKYKGSKMKEVSCYKARSYLSGKFLEPL